MLRAQTETHRALYNCRLVERGEPVALQIRRVRRYRREDLDRFLERARVEPAT